MHHHLPFPLSQLALAGSLLFLSCTLAQAQETPMGNVPATEAERVAPAERAIHTLATVEVTATLDAQSREVGLFQGASLQDTAALSSIVSGDQIDLFGNSNLDDALRVVPGTFTRDNVQNPGVAVNIRGLEGSGRVNMSIDGVRQGFRFTGHEAQGFTYVDPALLSSVQIRRGAVSGAGGAGALAGAANFRTLGVDDFLTDDKQVGGFASLSYANNPSHAVPSAGGALRLGQDWAIAAAVSGRKPGDYENGNGEKVANTGQDLRSGLVKLRYKPGAHHQLDLGTVLYDNDFAANSYHQNIDSKQYTVSYAFDPGSRLVNLKANLYRSDVRMEYSEPTGAFGSAVGRVLRNKGTGFDLTNTSRIGGSIITSYGVEYFRDNLAVVNSAAQPDRGVNGPGKSSMASVFSNTSFYFGKASLIAGLRYDRFTLDGEGSVSAVNPHGMPAGAFTVDRSDGAFSPKLTLAIDATDWLQPYVSLGRSMRAPTISETFIGGSHPGEGARQSFFPNPYLKPEKQTGLDIGVNVAKDGLFAHGDSLGLRLNVYRNKVQDYVVANFVGGTHFANVPGKSTVRGLEFESGYDAGPAFANINYARNKSKLPSQTNGFGAQSFLPDSVLGVTLGTRLLERRLTLGTRYYRVSQTDIGEINVPSGGERWEPSYGLWDVFASYDVNKNLLVRLNISNLSDRAYSPSLSTNPGDAGAIAKGRGRTATVSVKYTF